MPSKKITTFCSLYYYSNNTILDCLEICYLPKGKSALPSTQDLGTNAALRGPMFQSSVNKLACEIIRGMLTLTNFYPRWDRTVLFCQYYIVCKVIIVQTGQVTCQRSRCEMGNKQSNGPGHPTAFSINLLVNSLQLFRTEHVCHTKILSTQSQYMISFINYMHGPL